jgi:hypothetical protein
MGAGWAGFAMEPVTSKLGGALLELGGGAAAGTGAVGMTIPGTGVAMVVASTAGKSVDW